MAESTIQVRLVRCPKCKNLLPEPKDCSFFKCGGCGTVLCVKNKDRDADLVSVKSAETRAKETSAHSVSSQEESDSDSSLRHQQNGQTETWDVHSDPCPKLNVDDDDSPSGLDRFRQRTTKRCDFEGFRFSTSNYFTETLHSDEAINQDRAGLVRKLDKLKEQLVQPKEQHIPSSSSGFEKAPLRFFSSGKHISGPSYYHYYPEPEPPCPYNNDTDVSLHGLMHNPGHVPAYGDRLGFQMHERTLQPSHPHNSRRYVNNNGHDLFDTHPRNEMLPQSTCYCFRCYDPYQASGSVFPPSGLPDALRNVGFYPHDRSAGFGSSLHSPRAFIPRPPPGCQPRDRQLHGRYPSEFGDVQMNVSISHVRPPRAVSSSGLIRSVAGGAPFITCKNCFKVLQLPDKIDSATRKQQRVRCGACSCVIYYSFVDKKLILSTDPASAKKEEPHSRLRWESTTNFSSDDYDDAAYELHAMDRGPPDESGLALISDKAQEMQIAESTSPSVSEDELSSDSPTARTVTPDSPLHKHFEYSSINVTDRFGPRSRSSRSEQDRVTLSKMAMRQNSMKEASAAIEMDVNDYFHNSGLSQDSANDYTDDQGGTKKGRFASIVKNSFKDLKKSIQNEGRSDVSINGHPVAERLVKMAEKQAGPIRPGNYWYDYRAGFWGIMGNHCLGILPPFIEELNYPMPENCAGGTTRVFVNGRELHQKDLRLLTARGLPKERDRSYTVYISGRVIDEDTGEELDSLGKLAPTVDKLKRGFGMRVPRRAA